MHRKGSNHKLKFKYILELIHDLKIQLKYIIYNLEV